MVCDAPIVRGVLKGHPATGTPAGYYRHRKIGEPACRPCLDAINANVLSWREKNPEKHEAYEARRAPKKRALAAAWRAAHPERSRSAVKRWQEENRERTRELAREWSRSHPNEKRQLDRRRRARLSSAVTVPFTAVQLAERMAYWGNRCWMCGGPYESVDHVIPLIRGGLHCLANLRPACISCNCSKGAKLWEVGA